MASNMPFENEIIYLKQCAENIKYIPVEETTLEKADQVNWQFVWKESMRVIENQNQFIKHLQERLKKYE